MAVLGSRARRRQRTNYIRAILGVVFIVGCLALAIAYKTMQPRPINRNMCPADGPLGHTVLLVDKSDPLTFTQSREFSVLYEEVVTKRVPKGYLLSVYALGDDFQKTASPVIELCNPGDGNDVSPLTGNPDRERRQYQAKYVEPMMAKAAELTTTTPGQFSPLMEMIQLVGITGFRKNDVKGPRRLIIVSDMLHNTSGLSMYKTIPNFNEFLHTTYAAQATADLPGVQVELQVFMHSPAIQKPELLSFWEEYISNARGKLTVFNPIKG